MSLSKGPLKEVGSASLSFVADGRIKSLDITGINSSSSKARQDSKLTQHHTTIITVLLSLHSSSHRRHIMVVQYDGRI
jgi:hypothetical protein